MVKKTSEIINELADRASIQDCIYRYCRGIDRLDRELLLSAYWPDAVDKHGNFSANSAEEFVSHAFPILETMVLTSHSIQNILIDIQGDTAFVETYVQAFHKMRRDDGSLYDHLSGSRFLDQMERRNEEWRINHRSVVRDWFHEFPDSFSWQTGKLADALDYGKDAPLDIGRRKGADLSDKVLKFSL